MFKTTRLFKILSLKTFKTNNNKVVRVDNRANKIIVNLFNKLKNNKSRNLIYIPNIRTTKELISPTFNAKKTFNYLKQAFIKSSIL